MKTITDNKQAGFTFIEVVIFIIVTSILASTLLLSLYAGLKNSPLGMKTAIASQTANQCMEWFIGQKKLNGYTAFSCPSTSVPSFCSTPSGYSLSVNISCTTINGDANYKTIAITVSGNGDASLTSIVANY